MVMTVVRIEITGDTQQHNAEFRQTIVESVRSAVLPSLSTPRRNKIKRAERTSFDALQHVPQVVRDRLDRTQQRRKRLDKLSPERRELYERIKKLRDEVGLVDFNIVDTLRAMREST